MELKKALESLKKYSVEDFQMDFDNLMSQVENDKKSFIITSEHGDVIIMPADDELIKIYTEHDEAS